MEPQTGSSTKHWMLQLSSGVRTAGELGQNAESSADRTAGTRTRAVIITSMKMKTDLRKAIDNSWELVVRVYLALFCNVFEMI